MRVDRVDQQPDHAFAGQFALQFLHGAGAEMIVAKRTIQIVGFQHDNLAFVIAQPVCFAVDVFGGELRRRLAELRRSRRGADES